MPGTDPVETGTSTVPLHRLPLRTRGRVAAVKADGPVRRRLLDLGFVPGTVVEPVRRSPFGEPTAYRVRGSLMALRNEHAGSILVEPLLQARRVWRRPDTQTKKDRAGGGAREEGQEKADVRGRNLLRG